MQQVLVSCKYGMNFKKKNWQYYIGCNLNRSNMCFIRSVNVTTDLILPVSSSDLSYIRSVLSLTDLI